jgi:hypothetical protein
MKTNDTSASKSTPAGMNPGEALQAADAVALRDHRAALPKAAELPQVQGTEFHVIKRYEPNTDGYRFLHGVALAWHQDRLFASFGHNSLLSSDFSLANSPTENVLAMYKAALQYGRY